MSAKVKIVGVASFLPNTRLTSIELEKRILEESGDIRLPLGSIEILTGVRERRVLNTELNASDLAVEAAKKALKNASLKTKDIDCLIFAAASGDIAEPATANIVQEKLGLQCPVFDIKNACNSFMNGIEVAEALIIMEKYKCILIVNGEVPSRFIRTKVKDQDQLKRSFAGYTLGDAGAAMILAPADGASGILYSKFVSHGQHWKLSTILGGGTRFPKDLDKNYFDGETAGLKDVFVEIGPASIYETLQKVGWSIEEVKKIFIHQVSAKSFDIIAKEANLPKDKMVIVLPELGNMAAASIPVALDFAHQRGDVESGDKVVLLGLASGISIATMALIW